MLLIAVDPALLDRDAPIGEAPRDPLRVLIAIQPPPRHPRAVAKDPLIDGGDAHNRRAGGQWAEGDFEAAPRANKCVGASGDEQPVADRRLEGEDLVERDLKLIPSDLAGHLRLCEVEQEAGHRTLTLVSENHRRDLPKHRVATREWRIAGIGKRVD